MRSIGTSVSSAVIGMVLADTSVTAGSVRVPSMEGFRISFLIAMGAVLIGLVLAAFLPSRRPSAHPVLLASSAGDARAARAAEPGERGQRTGASNRGTVASSRETSDPGASS